MPTRLILIGPPASGKGTQGRRMSECLDLPYLSTGALLREHVENETEIGLKAKPVLDRGGYLPDSLMCDMVGKWIEDKADGWVLDGFPRSLPQAEFLDTKLKEDGKSLTAAIALEAPFEELKARIEGRVECPDCRWSGGEAEVNDGACPECGGKVEPRADDSLENFTSRYQAYKETTLPLVDYYRERDKLCSCDATAPRDEVTSHLLEQVDRLA